MDKIPNVKTPTSTTANIKRVSCVRRWRYMPTPCLVETFWWQKQTFFTPMICSAKCQAFGWTPDNLVGKTGAMKHNPSQCCKVNWLLLCSSAWRKTRLHLQLPSSSGNTSYRSPDVSAFSSRTRRQLHGADLSKANTFSRSQKDILRILWNSIARCHVHNHPAILSQN